MKDCGFKPVENVITHSTEMDSCRIFKLSGGLITRSAMYDHCPRSKSWSRSQGYVTCQPKYPMVITTSHLVDTVTMEVKTFDTLAGSLGQIDQK